MPWGLSRTGRRADVLAALDQLHESARGQTKTEHEAALVDVMVETGRAVLSVAGVNVNPDGSTATAEDLDDFTTNLNMSGHIDDQGGVNIYASIQVFPPQRVGTLADGPTPNEVAAARASRERITETVSRINPAGVAGALGAQPAQPAQSGPPSAPQGAPVPQPQGAPAQPASAAQLGAGANVPGGTAGGGVPAPGAAPRAARAESGGGG